MFDYLDTEEFDKNFQKKKISRSWKKKIKNLKKVKSHPKLIKENFNINLK